MSVQNTLATLVLTGLIYHILVVVYRITIHPLARYPGRFRDKISGWPTIFDCNRGDRHIIIKRLHDRYGSVIRVAPNMLSFNTVTAMYTIYGNSKANIEKAAWYRTVDAGSGDYSTQTVIDKNEHAFRRRVIQPAFSERALRDAEKYINVNVDKLVQQLGQGIMDDKWTDPKDMSLWMTYFGFDFIGNLSFGSSFDLIDGEENRYLPLMLRNTSKFVYYAGYLPFNAVVRYLLTMGALNWFPNQIAQDAARFFELSEAKLQQREALEAEIQKADKSIPRRDLFHYLLNSQDPVTGKSFTKSQLHADSGLFIAAGSDGVAMVLSAALFYLLANPSTLVALTREIRSSFDSQADIAMPKLGSLQYLSAVIDETMRMTPPLPSALPRVVLKGGEIIDGLFISSGVDVGVAAYAIHHNDNYFPNSFKFLPGRWLAQDRVDEAKPDNKKAYVPFSIGPFNCVGRPVAYLACKLVLAKLLFIYDVKNGGLQGADEQEGSPGEYAMTDFLVGYRSGPLVQFRMSSKSE